MLKRQHTLDHRLKRLMARLARVGGTLASWASPVPGISLLLFGVLSIGTAGAGQEPEAGQGQVADDLANIRFLSDSRLFAVMTALNLAGFDHETPGYAMSETRTLVRDRLAGITPSLKTRLEAYFEEAMTKRVIPRDQPQTAFTSLALLLSPPPELKLQVQPADMPADVWEVKEFADLVSELYRTADLDSLWKELKPRYDEELAAYPAIMKQVIEDVLGYFRTPSRLMLDREIIVIADLLDVQNIVNARNLEREYYIVVGPAADASRNRRQLEHEYLHFLVDPLVRKFGIQLLRHEKLMDLVQRQPNVRSDYQNQFLLMAAESLVECLQMRLHPPGTEAESEEQVVALFRQGLILVPYFHREMEKYEASDWLSLPAYLETSAIKVTSSEIEEDSQRVSELEASARQRREDQLARQAEAESAERRENRLRELLADSRELLQAGRFTEARLVLEEVLKLEPDHGHALFYMAQVSSQLQEYDQAYLYYQRAASAQDVPLWVQAWSRLRLGRILAARGQVEEARQHFEAVLALDGELRGADEEARTLLQRLPEPG